MLAGRKQRDQDVESELPSDLELERNRRASHRN
jgi:hypothetical protein